MKLKLRNNPYKGKLIVFEGTDGAGKTTQITKTYEYLKEKLGENRVILTKQPTDMSRKTKLFQKMMYSCSPDVDYRALQLLTMSDRIQHLFEEIEPALKTGKIVLCDRFIYTSLANMLARGYKKEKWFFDAAKHIIKPDIAFLAYVEPGLAIKRIKSRPEECNRHLNEALLHGVAKEFYKMSEMKELLRLDTSGNTKIPFGLIKNKINVLLGDKNEKRA